MSVKQYLRSPLFLFAVLASVSWIFLIYQHEMAHSQIFEYFGCEDISYSVNLKDAFTTCNKRNATPTWEEVLAHSYNETVGYHIKALFLLIITAMTCLMLQMRRIDDGKTKA